MEDKNPFTPIDARFSAPENLDEHEQKLEKKDKKKKSRLSEWLSKFLRPEVDDDASPEAEEKRTKTWRVAEAFRNLFGKASGIETNELPEEQLESEQIAAERSLYFPLTTEFSPQPVYEQPDVDLGNDNNSSAELTNEVEQQTPAHTLPDQTNSARIEELPLQNNQHGIERPVPDLSEIAKDDVEPAKERFVSYEQKLEPDRRAEKEKEVVIERGGGGGAALLGFVAAETLSRSRDAKIRKEAKALKKQVDQLEKNQVQQTVELNEVRDKNRQQIEALRERRNEAGSENEVVIDHEKRTAPSPEQLAPKREAVAYEQVPRRPEQTLPSKSRVERHEPLVRTHIETPREAAPEHKDDALILEQAEKAAERDIPLESYYERRHEAKDVPTTPSHSGAATGVGTSTSSDDIQLTTSVLPDPVKAPAIKSPKPVPDLYAQAAKQGVYVGLLMIVAFLIIVFIWGLR